MRSRFLITYASGINESGERLNLIGARQIERTDLGLQRVVESIHDNFGFEGELGEWVAPSAVLSVELLGPAD